jgi:hypothetical protein
MDPKLKRIITNMVRNNKIYQNYKSIVEWEKKQLIEDGVITPEATEFDIEFKLQMGVDEPYHRNTDIGRCIFSANPRYYVIKVDVPDNGDRHIGDSYSSWGNELAALFGEEVEALLKDEGIRARVVSVSKIDDDYDAENYCPAISKYIVLSCKVRIKESSFD